MESLHDRSTGEALDSPPESPPTEHSVVSTARSRAMRSIQEAFRGGSGPQKRSGLKRYGAALGLALVAWALAVVLGSELSVRTHLPFAAAVVIATWYGGGGAGILSAVVAVLAIDFSFLPPFHSIELTHAEELVDTVLFLLVATIIGATTAALRRARELAEQRADDLSKANTELAAQMRHVQSLSQDMQAMNEYLASAHAQSARLAAPAQR